MTTLVTSYRLLTSNPDRTSSQIANQPVAAREIAYYKANIGNIKTIDDFLKDQRLFTFAMKAFGLGDMVYAKAFMKKALQEGTDSTHSFSMKLADPRFRNFVNTFNFKLLGTATTTSNHVTKDTVKNYIENQLEEQAGNQSDGLRLALYFKNNIASVSTSYGILGNAAIYQVVRTALGLPQALSSVNVDTQAKLIDSKFSLSDMKDPKKLEAFVTRFLSLYDLQQGVTAAASPALSLFSGSAVTVDMNTVLSLQSLRKFGN